jgi:hypothetical protein
MAIMEIVGNFVKPGIQCFEKRIEAGQSAVGNQLTPSVEVFLRFGFTGRDVKNEREQIAQQIGLFE